MADCPCDEPDVGRKLAGGKRQSGTFVRVPRAKCHGWEDGHRPSPGVGGGPGRSILATVNPRPFAPTASQRWATVALQNLKELDVLSTRRREIAGKEQPQPRDPTNSTAKPFSKKKGGKGEA